MCAMGRGRHVPLSGWVLRIVEIRRENLGNRVGPNVAFGLTRRAKSLPPLTCFLGSKHTENASVIRAPFRTSLEELLTALQTPFFAAGAKRGKEIKEREGEENVKR